MYSKFFATFCMITLTAGCEQAVNTDQAGQVANAQIVHNGQELNGLHVNGLHVNGLQVNGLHVNGLHVNGLQVNGLHVNGTQLEGTLSDTGEIVSGTELIGTVLTGELSDSTQISFRIDDAVTESTGRYSYQISYYNDANQSWDNACSNGVRAYALDGRWDYQTVSHIDDSTMFTFGCRDAALGKCVDFGYARGAFVTEQNASSSQQLALSDFHQACIRMLRADYCGDGVSHTVNGTTIDVWDNFGLQSQTPDSGLDFEAEWSPSGATCIKHVRWTYDAYNTDTMDYIATHCPSRFVGPSSTSCGGDVTGGSTFYTENGYSTSMDSRSLLRNASTQQ